MASTPISELTNANKIYSNDIFVISQNNKDTNYCEESRNVTYEQISSVMWSNIKTTFDDVKYTNIITDKEYLRDDQLTSVPAGRVGKQLLTEIESIWNEIDIIKNFLIPIGTMMPYIGSSSKIPDNWLLCDGRFVNYSEYPDLYEVLEYSLKDDEWDTYTKSFKIPNLTDERYLRGDAVANNYFEEGLPKPFTELKATVTEDSKSDRNGSPINHYSGCPGDAGKLYTPLPTTSKHNHNVKVTLTATYNNIYGRSNTVRPKTYTVLYIIKAK